MEANLKIRENFPPVFVTSSKAVEASDADFSLWHGDVEKFLRALPKKPIFDLFITSPPYNIGKEYEEKLEMEDYLKQNEKIISLIYPLLKETGSICWQVGNYIDKKEGSILPLDIILHPIFAKHNLKLKNRIIWKFGHGLHAKKRFSGRYETILWYTKSEDYIFNLDDVRIPSKYPGKKHYKGPNKGKYSSNPLGKNPEDVWEIPNVKGNHVEKTIHPCQFPVGLVERLILAFTNRGDLVFDPFAGVATTGVSAALKDRKFVGAELERKYINIGIKRIEKALKGNLKYRPHDRPLYDHKKSKLSIVPEDFT